MEVSPILRVGNREISYKTFRPFIVAEIGVNYYEIAEKRGISLIEAAKLMIKEAADAGADAVKFQIYKAEKLASKKAVAYWDTTKEKERSQYYLFKKYDKLDEKDYTELAKFAETVGIVFFATPFDFESADLVNKLAPAIKVASADITNYPLLRHIARFKKPIFLSTGASKLSEIYDAVNVIVEEGNNEIAILHCVLEYPTPYKDANLGAISYLKKVFPQYIIGYSDHTVPDEGMLVLTLATILGARIIEKHFTLDKTIPGNDHYHSMDPMDLRRFIRNIELIEKIFGREMKFVLKGEEKARKFARRSLIAARKIDKGEIITLDKIAIKRPGTGISPRFIDIILGKKAAKNIEEDEPITWDHVLLD